jgi:hypothetical protein
VKNTAFANTKGAAIGVVDVGRPGKLERSTLNKLTGIGGRYQGGLFFIDLHWPDRRKVTSAAKHALSLTGCLLF